MSSIESKLERYILEMDSKVRNTMSGAELRTVLVQSLHEIRKFRTKYERESWLRNPDRSGGQFSDWELTRRGDEFS